MIKFINKFTGTIMWVTEERKEEYMAAGHTVANCDNPIVETVEKPAEPKRGRKKK